MHLNTAKSVGLLLYITKTASIVRHRQPFRKNPRKFYESRFARKRLFLISDKISETKNNSFNAFCQYLTLIY